MKAVALKELEFDAMLAKLSGAFRIYAPVRFAGEGRMADTSVVRYDQVTSLRQIELDLKSDYSPKEALLPISEPMLNFTPQGQWVEAPETDHRGILVFARACDIHAFERLDEIYLSNGAVADPWYQRARSKTLFVLLECRESFENCFCVSMGCNTTDNYAMAIRRTESGVLAQVRDKGLLEALPESSQPSEFAPQFVSSNPVTVNLPDLQLVEDAIAAGLFDHEFWKEYSRRCVACGRCTVSCGDCSCFTTVDAPKAGDPATVERRRVWASCHIDRFTDMAGGHEFRKDYGSRMRYRVMHKIYDYPRRFGKPMCTGCGRCDDQCPEYISFSNCVNKLSNLLKEEPNRV